MIVAVCMARNEEAIIGSTVAHLLAEGLDEVYVEDGHSTDDTRRVAKEAGAVVWDETDRAYRQGERMSAFAAKVCSTGDWCIPFDADEFWYSDSGTIREALGATDADVCRARMFLHRDWDYRAREPKPLCKVAFRWHPGATLRFGNHAVVLRADSVERSEVLDLREWQHRSLAHFKAKVVRQGELIENTPGMDLANGEHMNRLVGMSDSELEAEYEQVMDHEWVFDPIPSEFRCPA